MEKIIYLGHKDRKYKEIEDGVIDSLKLMGYKVILFDDQEYKPEEVIEACKGAKMFLFHKGGFLTKSETEMYASIDKLIYTLSKIDCKKVLWFVDKVWMEREIFIDRIINYVDYSFFTDETFLRRHKIFNAYSLKQGCQIKRFKGKKNPAFECDVAFIGSIYGERQMFVKALGSLLGDKFRTYNEIRDQDFADLCKSAKIIISPNYPMDDFYWSNRIYEVLGNGGFMFHPNFAGLKDEGIKEGEHYIGYTNWLDVEDKLEYLLSKKADKLIKSITKQGQKEVVINHTYLQRCRKILEIVK
jgi:hypothetical protein